MNSLTEPQRHWTINKTAVGYRIENCLGSKGEQEVRIYKEDYKTRHLVVLKNKFDLGSQL